MTQIITRYFGSIDQAQATERLLLSKRLPQSIIRIYSKPEGLADTLIASHVAPATAKAYQDKVAGGGAVMRVAANYTPLGVAKTTRQVMRDMGADHMDGFAEEAFVKDKPGHTSSIFADHRRFMTRAKDPSRTNHYMANWPIPLISRRIPNSESLIPRHGRMADFPIPLTVRHKPRDEFAFPRHARMANIILPLTIRRKPTDRFMFDRHARMANFPIPLISKRKPWTGSIFPRHARMATVPFPLLINQKTGANALMPGAPRMANFPIPLLSGRKPFDKSIFSRHARMGNLILPLISKRKPFTGSIFSRHARMANFPIPLVSKRGGGFSFSKMLGLPILAQR